MREIKFRAWDKNDKVMHENDGICLIRHYKKDTMIAVGLNGVGTNNLNCSPLESILMQYTGLKDKNGVEIYEGDILRSQPNTKIFKVGWSDIRAKWQAYYTDGIKYKNGNDMPFSDAISRHMVYEVIGNIYENPELLEDKNV